MTKTLTVLSILVPITVPTYCAMLDLQTALHLKVSQVSKSGPNPLQKFVKEPSSCRSLVFFCVWREKFILIPIGQRIKSQTTCRIVQLCAKEFTYWKWGRTKVYFAMQASYGPPPPTAPSMSQCVTRVQLNISCRNLLDKDVMSKSDPMAVVMILKEGRWFEVSLLKWCEGLWRLLFSLMQLILLI